MSSVTRHHSVYYGNYHGMLVSNTMVIYHGVLTLEKVGTAVNYHYIFIVQATNRTNKWFKIGVNHKMIL